MKIHTLSDFLSRLDSVLHKFPIQEKRKTTYTGTRKKLPQNYDISLTCDLMEFPLSALARKIYFILEAWRNRWPPPVLDKLLKVKIFTVKKFILL